MKRMVCVWRGCGDEKSGSMHGRAHGGCETDGDVCVCVCVCVCGAKACTALHCTARVWIFVRMDCVRGCVCGSGDCVQGATKRGREKRTASNQTRQPAELKHISKRRKRN
jgi:hypothetical protein